VLWTTLRVGRAVHVTCVIMGLPLAYVLARTQSRFKNVADHAGGAALFVGKRRARGRWMTLFGSKGFLNVT